MHYFNIFCGLVYSLVWFTVAHSSFAVFYPIYLTVTGTLTNFPYLLSLFKMMCNILPDFWVSFYSVLSLAIVFLISLPLDGLCKWFCFFVGLIVFSSSSHHSLYPEGARLACASQLRQPIFFVCLAFPALCFPPELKSHFSMLWLPGQCMDVPNALRYLFHSQKIQLPSTGC